MKRKQLRMKRLETVKRRIKALHRTCPLINKGRPWRQRGNLNNHLVRRLIRTGLTLKKHGILTNHRLRLLIAQHRAKLLI